MIGSSPDEKIAVCVLYVLFNLLCMSSCVEEDILDACASEELEGIFDQRRIGEGQKTLGPPCQRDELGLCCATSYSWAI